jgi:hypothetical protein
VRAKPRSATARDDFEPGYLFDGNGDRKSENFRYEVDLLFDRGFCSFSVTIFPGYPPVNNIAHYAIGSIIVGAGAHEKMVNNLKDASTSRYPIDGDGGMFTSCRPFNVIASA